MKKILVMMLVVVLCMAMLSGCGSNTGDTDVIGSSDTVEENTESSTEADMTDGEAVATSEEESEIVEETVMFSADEVMAHIDTLITQYTYNNPEHIKALIIAANLDYISEEELDTILTAHGYAMEDLAALYDECILDNGTSLKTSFAYSQGNIDSLSDEEKYENRVTLESAMMNDYDKEIAKWYDTLLIDKSNGYSVFENEKMFIENLEKGVEVSSSVNVTIYSYTCSVRINKLKYSEYLDNPYVNYANVNS